MEEKDAARLLRMIRVELEQFGWITAATPNEALPVVVAGLVRGVKNSSELLERLSDYEKNERRREETLG